MDTSTNSWNDAYKYRFGWGGYITLLVPTLIVNLTVLYLVSTSHRLKKSTEARILKYLMIEDAGFSLCCLIQCIINLSHLEIYGHNTGCIIQSVYATFFVLSAGYTLCVIAYNLYRKIHMKTSLDAGTVLKLHIIFWIWSAIISVLTSYVFPPRIMPSETYCLPSLLELGSGLLFYLPGVGIIGIYLVVCYTLIYLEIKKVTKNLSTLDSRRLENSNYYEAKKRQTKAAKKMINFVIAYFLCALPVLIVSITEVIIGYSLSPVLHLIAGHLVHLNSLLDPILYFWLNPNSRLAFKEFIYYLSCNKYYSTEIKIIEDNEIPGSTHDTQSIKTSDRTQNKETLTKAKDPGTTQSLGLNMIQEYIILASPTPTQIDNITSIPIPITPESMLFSKINKIAP